MIREDDLPDVLDRLAGPHELDRRQPQPLLVDLRRGARERADRDRADLGHVADRRREGDELAVVEDRPEEHVLRHVAAAAERVVVDHDVARLERGGAELVEHAANRLADRAEVRGVEAALGDHPALAVEESAREVARLAEDRRVGGAHHVRAHLLGDLHELVADHAHRHAVDALRRAVPATRAPESRRMPSASTRSAWPGRTSVVESGSSTTAGPWSAAPAGRSSRR